MADTQAVDESHYHINDSYDEYKNLSQIMRSCPSRYESDSENEGEKRCYTKG